MPLLLVTYTLLIIMPVVPAYVLFTALPSSANVRGRLQGLELKLGGAFAGYFALLVFTFVQLPKVRQFVTPETHQVWTVVGNLRDDQGNGVLVGPCEVHFTPDPYNSAADGWFQTSFIADTTGVGTVSFPHLSIGHTGFPPMPIPLDPDALKQQGLEHDRNMLTHTITLNPITLTKPSQPYSPPNNNQPAQVDPATYLNTVGKVGPGRGNN